MILHAGALVEAYGIGSENCVVEVNRSPKYEGQPFWGPDSFSALVPGTHKVVISGSGDGAIQDLIRIVTGGMAPIAILKQLDESEDTSIPADMRLELLSAEDEAHRGRSWAHDDDPTLRRQHQEPYFERLEDIHRSVVSRLLATKPAVIAALDHIVSNRVEVDVVYREPFITAYYGLNRFLAILISEFLEKHVSDPSARQRILHPGCQIDDIDPTIKGSHNCLMPVPGMAPGTTVLRASGVYNAYGLLVSHDCFGERHTVVFGPATLPQTHPYVVSPPPTGDYNVVIVRHGIRTRLHPALKRTNHLLPYGQS